MVSTSRWTYTDSGAVNIGFAVDGQITRQEVKGTLGSGQEAKITAHTASGGIDLGSR